MISEAEVWDALREVRDPEVGIGIVDLGLVYEVTVAAGSVYVALTMTTRACPLSGYIAEVAEDAIRRRNPAAAVEIAIVWEPPWTPDLLSDEAKRRLGRAH
jgi:metal-sulfur cluster biosynthetic enzyme